MLEKMHFIVLHALQIYTVKLQWKRDTSIPLYFEQQLNVKSTVRLQWKVGQN